MAISMCSVSQYVDCVKAGRAFERKWEQLEIVKCSLIWSQVWNCTAHTLSLMLGNVQNQLLVLLPYLQIMTCRMCRITYHDYSHSKSFWPFRWRVFQQMAITSEEKTHRLCNLEYVAMLRFLCLIDKEIINFLDYHTECWPSLSVFEGPRLCSKSIRHEKRLSKFIWQECVKRHLLRKYFRNNSTQSALSCRPSTIISMNCVSMFRFWMHALSVDV